MFWRGLSCFDLVRFLLHWQSQNSFWSYFFIIRARIFVLSLWSGQAQLMVEETGVAGEKLRPTHSHRLEIETFEYHYDSKNKCDSTS